jgi:hypothetical protein
MLMNARHGLGFSLLKGIVAHEGDDELGILELESSLSDVEKPLELPAGLYEGEVQDVTIGTSKAGNKYYAVSFVVSPDQIGADVADQFEDGAKLFWNRVVVPSGRDRRALFNLRKFIEALGIDSNTTQIDPNDWMGRKARLKVVHSTYQGETRAEIKAVESAEGSAPKTKAAAAPAAARGRSRK